MLEVERDAAEVAAMLTNLLDPSKGDNARRMREKDNFLFQTTLVNPLMNHSDEFTRQK